MAKKIGKREKKKKRVMQPSSYFIGSEGEKTEALYFSKFSESLLTNFANSSSFKHIPFFEVQGMGTSNFSLIDDVEDYLRTSPIIYEHIWILFDLDDIPLCYFDNSISSAESKGFKVGWSNNSFELWYVYHFRNLQSDIHRDDYTKILNEEFQKNGLAASYEKTDPNVFYYLQDKLDKAIKYASKALSEYASNEYPCSKKAPCTNVVTLIKELLELEDKLRL